MLRLCRLGTLVIAVAAVGVVLAPTSGAKSRGSNTVTCSLSAGTTFTWEAGTTEITYVFRGTGGTITQQGTITPGKRQAGSTTIPTDPGAATVQATWFVKSIGGEMPPVSCTA